MTMNDDDFFDLDDDFAKEDPFKGTTMARPVVRTVEEFDEEVDEKIKILMGRRNDPKVRADAAYWLGNSGAPKAISALRTVYEKDTSNKAVQQAAEYALGQFKALDQAIVRRPGESVTDALGRPENAKITDRLTDIALNDMRGKRLRIRPRVMMIINLMLLLALAGLVYLNLNLPQLRRGGGAADTLRGTGTIAQRSATELSLRLDELQADVEELQSQLTGAQAGEALNCAYDYTLPVRFTLDPVVDARYPQIKAAAEGYNGLHEDVIAARRPYDTACQTSATISEQQTTSSLSSLETLLAAFPGVEQLINEANIAANTGATSEAQATGTGAVPPTATSLPTDTPLPPTETPTPTATPGLSAQELRTYTNELYSLIDSATAARGFIPLLNQYWTEARDTGRTDGCNTPRPAIPDDYVLEEDVRAVSPELVGITDLVNTGLQLSRSGWDLFDTACSLQTFSGNAQIGLDTMAAARATLDEALVQLNELTGN
jgi:hypothetical protein